MSGSVKIIGYYDHSNLGDEQYKLTFAKILPNYNLQFIDCDKLKNAFINDSDIIILGGGDILNDYFLDKVIQKFKGKPNKIFAVSVGIPYTNILVNTNKLNIIDYIFIRTEQDIDLLSKYFDKDRIFYLPDISSFISNTCVLFTEYTQIKKIKENSDRKIIAICLSRHIYNKNPDYTSIINTFAKMIRYLVNFNYTIVLLPFNTKNSHTENDILIHDDVYNLLDSQITRHVINIRRAMSPTQAMRLFKLFYAVIPMRFHACLFAIHNKIPFFPIFTTRKINNLLLDIHWTIGFKLDCDEYDIPKKIDEKVLMTKFGNLFTLYNSLKTKLQNLRLPFDNVDILHKLIEDNSIFQKNGKTLKSPVIEKVENCFNKVQEYSLNQGVFDFRLINKDYHQIITQMVSYYLTKRIDSEYNYGLIEKMFYENYDYISEWKWIVENESKKKLVINYSNPSGLFNLNFADQNDYSGVHRSGWQHVYTYLKDLQNDSVDLFLDLYVDKTFHWNNKINTLLNIIPYRQNWVGFIHHTFETEFSEYNTRNLLNNPQFIESLKCCKGVFVLSRSLKRQFDVMFNSRGIRVPVFHLIHPTETNVPQFNYTSFLNNRNKQIIHVGGWLRNVYSYYLMDLPKTIKLQQNCFLPIFSKDYTLQKSILKGNHMNNYFPLPDFKDDFKHFLSSENKDNPKNLPQISHPHVSHGVSRNCNENIMNNWYKEYYNHYLQMEDSLNVIERLTDIEYDELLTNNIIFINLTDASAVNTLIECIVRNTPIVINKHPAVVELLGEDYPLYFSDNYSNYYQMNNEIVNLLSNKSNIKRAYEHMKQISKRQFHISYFIDKLLHILNKI